MSSLRLVEDAYIAVYTRMCMVYTRMCGHIHTIEDAYVAVYTRT